MSEDETIKRSCGDSNIDTVLCDEAYDISSESDSSAKQNPTNQRVERKHKTGHTIAGLMEGELSIDMTCNDELNTRIRSSLSDMEDLFSLDAVTEGLALDDCIEMRSPRLTHC